MTWKIRRPARTVWRQVAKIAAVVAVALPAATYAEPSSVPVPDPASCELHVWPSSFYLSTVDNALAAFLPWVPSGKVRDRNPLMQILSPEAQLDIITEGDLAAGLGLPPAKIIKHEALLDPERSTVFYNGRRSESSSGCYSEVVVLAIQVNKTAVISQLKVNLVFRDFGAKLTDPRSISQTYIDRIRHFPTKAGDDPAVATNELIATFKDFWGRFAIAARRRNSKFYPASTANVPLTQP